ncbi:MAG: S1C family serine protease [bacterium]|nr:S1C family serine protease [bacterium]
MGTIKSLYVLILLALALFVLTFSQQFATGQSIYPLPPPSSQASMVDYPEKVKESLKNIVGITVEIDFKTNDNHRVLGQSTKATGTGFMFQPGIFISARHILMSGIDRLTSVGYQATFDQHGVPLSNFFSYSVIGTSDVNEQTRDFDLNLVGMGATDKFEDYMVLQSSNYPLELKPIEHDDKPLNIDDIVYNAGYVHLFLLLGNSQIESPILFDIIRKSFPGRVDAITKNLPINQRGVSVLYRIETKLEQGFSGGPILNSEGKVVAITILRNDNFLYAIPIQDIKLFIEKLKKDNVIK